LFTYKSGGIASMERFGGENMLIELTISGIDEESHRNTVKELLETLLDTSAKLEISGETAHFNIESLDLLEDIDIKLNEKGFRISSVTVKEK
jgi:adenine deaminase